MIRPRAFFVKDRVRSVQRTWCAPCAGCCIAESGRPQEGWCGELQMAEIRSVSCKVSACRRATRTAAVAAWRRAQAVVWWARARSCSLSQRARAGTPSPTSRQGPGPRHVFQNEICCVVNVRGRCSQHRRGSSPWLPTLRQWRYQTRRSWAVSRGRAISRPSRRVRPPRRFDRTAAGLCCHAFGCRARGHRRCRLPSSASSSG